MMRKLFVATLLLALPAGAQTPEPRPDVFWPLTGQVHTAKAEAPTDADLVEVCFVRVDVEPNVELGCIPAEPGAIVQLDLTIAGTMGTDAIVRAYAVDTSGYKSDLSPNKATADFTAPGPPFVLTMP